MDSTAMRHIAPFNAVISAEEDGDLIEPLQFATIPGECLENAKERDCDATACPICFAQILRVNTCIIGHAICRVCAKRQWESDKRCPVCRKVSSMPFTCVALQNMIAEKSVRCLNRAGGEECEWKGTVGDLELHLQRGCPLQLVSCPRKGCELVVHRRDKKDHLMNRCVMREVECELCFETMVVKDLREHREHCGDSTIVCEMVREGSTRVCKKAIKRNAYMAHLEECHGCGDGVHRVAVLAARAKVQVCNEKPRVSKFSIDVRSERAQTMSRTTLEIVAYNRRLYLKEPGVLGLEGGFRPLPLEEAVPSRAFLLAVGGGDGA